MLKEYYVQHGDNYWKITKLVRDIMLNQKMIFYPTTPDGVYDGVYNVTQSSMPVKQAAAMCRSMMSAYGGYEIPQDKYDIRKLDDDMYPNVTMGEEIVDGVPHSIDATTQQYAALFRKWKQDDNGMTWKEFAHSVKPTFHMDNAVTVQWCGMWLAIEEDGYTHS
jgi:hypothetical protein